MKFGLQHPNFTYDGSGSTMADALNRLATRAESLKFDSFWVMDHFHQIRNVGQPQEPMLEGWTTQSFLAALTTRIKLGVLVTGIVYRYPSVLAKIGATFDVLSKGRLIMGIGAAWNSVEARAYGIPFPQFEERMQRLEEAVQIIRKMWTEDIASFNGKFYQIKDAYCNPKPAQKPHPPIMIGGSSEQHTLKIVSKYADACNLFGSPDTVRKKLAILRGHCKTVGRDCDSILKTKLSYLMLDKDSENLEQRVAKTFRGFSEAERRESVIYGTPEGVRRQIEAFRDVGIEYLIVYLEAGQELDTLELFGSEIIGRI